VSSLRKAVLIGVGCGLAAVVLVRVGVWLLLAGVKALAVVAVVGALWFALRPGRRRRR
jgi:hypothetical protein